MVTASPVVLLPRVRWTWLWGTKDDIGWNFAPFWAGLLLAGVLFAARDLGGVGDNPVWNFQLFGHPLNIAAILLYLYSPLVDAPHLWATIARTYTDPEEWAQRRRLFLGSLGWFLIGPVVIALPYVLHATVGFPEGKEPIAWLLWTRFFELYALHHIAKQHWGFISLYKRKNADLADATENRVDAVFFRVVIWLPYFSMLSAPWYRDFDNAPFRFLMQPIAGSTLGSYLHQACNLSLLVLCFAYAAFQIERFRRGKARNGPKLAYIATIIPLYFVAFCVHPLLAMFWVIITGTGHCAQYHRVVWAYGKSKYADNAQGPGLPTRIFRSVWLYIALGILYGIIGLQGPTGVAIQRHVAAFLQGSVLQRAFAYLDQNSLLDLAGRMTAALAGGLRLHHFYVDSKIWRVSKSAALAKNLSVSG
jgi:hypothetical protein